MVGLLFIKDPSMRKNWTDHVNAPVMRDVGGVQSIRAAAIVYRRDEWWKSPQTLPNSPRAAHRSIFANFSHHTPTIRSPYARMVLLYARMVLLYARMVSVWSAYTLPARRMLPFRIYFLDLSEL